MSEEGMCQTGEKGTGERCEAVQISLRASMSVTAAPRSARLPGPAAACSLAPADVHREDRAFHGPTMRQERYKHEYVSILVTNQTKRNYTNKSWRRIPFCALYRLWCTIPRGMRFQLTSSSRVLLT